MTKKKQACLRGYFDSGNARWDHVMKAVGGVPFYNGRIVFNIAKKFLRMDRRKCLDSFLKDEL